MLRRRASVLASPKQHFITGAMRAKKWYISSTISVLCIAFRPFVHSCLSLPFGNQREPLGDIATWSSAPSLPTLFEHLKLDYFLTYIATHTQRKAAIMWDAARSTHQPTEFVNGDRSTKSDRHRVQSISPHRRAMASSRKLQVSV